MRPTATFLRQCIRMTFFTRPNCSLCDEAKHVLSKVWDRKPFEYDEIDVMKQGQDKWKALYQFDTPVLHIDAAEENDSSFETTTTARKLMHRFKEDDVEQAMSETMDNNTTK